MSSTVDTLSLQPRSSWIDKAAKKRVFGYLQNLKNARILLEENGKLFEFGELHAPLSCKIEVHHPRFYSMVALSGTIGAGEAYMSGYWNCDCLVTLIRIFASNLKQVQAMDSSAVNVLRWIDLLNSRLNPNSLNGSSQNIAKHYDLGNEFFELFLDQSMMYSAAMYKHDSDTLEQASEHKLKTIGQKLELKQQDHLLEIGTGWGGLAIFMAKTYACKVTTTTISNAQYHYACEKVSQAGLQDRITVLKRDYRLLKGSYDKLVSIEMIEAVGHKYLPVYFQTCNSLLKPGGKMLLQAITIPEQRYAAAIKQVDFIQKHIFPGGCLPSIEIILHQVGKHTQLQLQDLDDMTASYAKTLGDWRQRYLDNLNSVKNLGYDESFIRMWDFYLSYCEAGFLEKSIGTFQLVFERNQ